MTLFSGLEALLEERGFASAVVRRVAAAAILVSAALLVLGGLLLPFLSWPFWLGAGAALGCWNFVSMAFVVQRIFAKSKGTANISGKILLAQLAGTNLRLFITGILVYVSLVSFSANVFALAGGLSVTVFLIPLLALGRNDRPEDSSGQGKRN